MSAEAVKKRKARDASSISPPPTRRKKVQSTTTKTAVSSFFTPLSQKPADSSTKPIWQQRSASEDKDPTLLVGKYNSKEDSSGPLTKRRKIAAFDLDGTLIRTASGKQHASDSADWAWWHLSVPQKLRRLQNEDGYQIVLFSNQKGLSFKKDAKGNKLMVFKPKAAAILSQLNLNTTLYAATEDDIFRKPRPGMWKEMIEDYDLDDNEGVDMENSFFVGDAAGRPATNSRKPKDFSCSDRNLAHNIGIKFFTPEEYFLGEEAEPFVRDFEPSKLVSDAVSSLKFSKINKQDIVVFVGSPGAGKSTFYWKNLKPLGYERINQDSLKTRDRCLKVAQEMLSEGKSVAIDNTNKDENTRGFWTAMAAKNKIPIRCVLFSTSRQVCEHNAAVRALNPSMNPESRIILPKIAFNTFNSQFRKPSLSEGFQDITEVEFQFDGNEAECEVFIKHWT